jgi:4-hydroxybenzoate polyprenyltransferase
MRTNFAMYAIVAPAGWLVAAHPPGPLRLLAITAAIAISGGASNVFNDILDAEKDATTAPELPLPSRLVTFNQAATLLGGLALVVVTLLALASTSVERFAAGAALIAAAAVAAAIYPFAKRWAVVPLVLKGIAYADIPLAAWAVAGGGPVGPLLPVLAFAFFFGIASNVHATLRDVDADGLVGNQSISVLLGPERALKLAALLDFIAASMILVVGATQERLAIGAALAGTVLLALAITYASVQRRQAGAHGRRERTTSVRPVDHARTASQVAVVMAVSLPVGAVVGAVAAWVVAFLGPRYRRRVMAGGLRLAIGGASTAARSSK